MPSAISTPAGHAHWSRPPAYQPYPIEKGRAALADVLPGTTAMWDEAALAEIEAHVRARRAVLGAMGPWGAHYDADLTLGRTLYGLCRALLPSLVVETGVAHRLSSAFLLQALCVKGHGELHSIDLPPLSSDARATAAVGVLIPRDLKARWRLHLGATRRLLRSALAGRDVDLFVQDSSHTYRTVSRAYAEARRRLSPGGVLVSDDIECSQAFDELRARHPAFWGCFAQQSKRALFGVAVKEVPQ